MLRRLALLVLLAVTVFAANFRLYLADGGYHVVREYEVQGDRVRFYSVERSEWEQVPLSLVDLKRTEAERQQRQQALEKEAADIAAEAQFERQQREERERVPVEPGVYLVEGGQLRAVRQAESKVVTSKGRAVLKILAPMPIVTGRATVELEGEHSASVISIARPEFYFRLAQEERLGIVRLGAKRRARIVQRWDIVPVSNEIVEQQQDVPIFRKQVAEGLYKIWPEQPLAPGEYAVIEYTEGKRNVQVWDFSYAPAR
ncbi:MAG: hypothetical protein ABSD56_13995 [Bryobacteraceae bacterium]